jgi:photosystem II stability/assembly factor-like uncharacterized protein
MFPTSYLRPGMLVLCCAIGLALGVPDARTRHDLQAQESPGSSTEQQRQGRLEEIERRLRELIQDVQALQNEGRHEAGSAATSSAAGPPAATESTAQQQQVQDWLGELRWRSIGPANMGGRIVDVAVADSDPSLFWIATSSGGLLKTINNGVTFEHQFDGQTTVSIGSVAVAASDTNVVWVGTGENNPRNSVSYGDGVYKSLDGGKTWQHMGLEKTFQIGRIVIHPQDPNIVYVGALGRLYGPSEDRGLYKTTDGGATWQKILFVDNQTGVIDLRMHPADPQTLLVATWTRKRDAFDSWLGEEIPDGYNGYDPVVKWGPGSGIYKTTDGGQTFRRLTAGLPSGQLGRVGLDYYHKDPNVVFAIIDCDKIGMGTPPKTQPASNVYAGIQGEDAEGGARITAVTAEGPSEKAGVQAGDMIDGVDDKAIGTYEELIEEIRNRKPGDAIKLKVQRDDKRVEIEVTLEERPTRFGGRGGGGQAPRGFAGFLGEDGDKGVPLTRIVEQSPAEKAGLKVGDIVQSVDGAEVGKYEQLLEKLRDKGPGDKLKLQVLRGEATQEIELVLGERPGSIGPGGGTATRPWSAHYGGQRENIQDQQGPDSHEYGGVYKSTDGGESWTRINSLNPRPMYFSQVRVDPQDDKYVYVLGVSLYRSNDGGKTLRPDGGRGVHADQHSLWINPRDGRHMIVGTDGGTYVTYDRMANWDHLNHTAIGQFYHVAISPRQPYYVFGGLQDNGSWGGPGMTRNSTGPVNEDWLSIGGGDGFVCRVDPHDPDWVYFESQNGAIGRRNLQTGERGSIRPPRTEGDPPYRFNWNTPFILSHHNSRIFYSAGNYVFRSLDRGDNLQVISPEITLSNRGSATALAESPRNPNVLYVGTDDGALWVTLDGGREWVDIGKHVGLPGPRWVSTVEPSRYVDGRCYVAFDAHRSDDDEPYVFVTEDFGKTWQSLRGNLPRGSTRCLREDPKNPDLLFLGTEFAAWCSLDRGQYWYRLNSNLPTVAVHEFAFHPVSSEMVAATHGRSLWTLDIAVLRQLSAERLSQPAILFNPEVAVRWQSDLGRGRTNRRFAGQNPPGGASIYYALTQKAENASLKVVDVNGTTVRELRISNEPGLHRVTWDLLRVEAERPAAPPSGLVASGQVPAGRGASGRFRRVRRARRVRRRHVTGRGARGNVGGARGTGRRPGTAAAPGRSHGRGPAGRTRAARRTSDVAPRGLHRHLQASTDRQRTGTRTNHPGRRRSRCAGDAGRRR